MRLATFFLLTLFLFNGSSVKSQCSVTSTNGWVATFNITPIAVIPEFTSCPNYYHYEIRYRLTVTFTGSTNNRSVSGNIYFTCSGGTGGSPYNSLGTFNANTTVTLTTNNNTRQYNAISTNNYGSNPNCNQVNLSHVNCTSARIDYWGNNTVGSSMNCSLAPPSSLPVELLSFGAFANKKTVDVEWSTASEKNSESFTLEKSKDGVNFETVTTIDAAGNSSTLRNYSFNDAKPYSGISYYRLKQTDKDKTFKYFHMVSINMSETKTVIGNIYPNPANTYVGFDLTAATDGLAEISITDVTGKIISTQNTEVTIGSNAISVNTTDLDNGIYFLNVKFVNDNFSGTYKLLKSN